MNKFSKFYAIGIALMMSIPSFAGVLTGYTFPDWSEVNNLSFSDDNSKWSLDSDKKGFSTTAAATLKTTVNITGESVICYNVKSGSSAKLELYVDNVKVEEFSKIENEHSNSLPWFGSGLKKYFINVPSGNHTIEWRASEVTKIDIINIGVLKAPLFNVNLSIAGSLHTEAMFETNNLKDIRNLKVSGKINDDDLGVITRMDNLINLDLSEATCVDGTLPAGAFKETSSLHSVKLPEGLVTLGYQAFYKSSVEHVTIPSTLKKAGESCFEKSYLREIEFNDDCTDWGYTVLYDCIFLRKAVLPKNLASLPSQTLKNCNNLQELTLPAQINSFGSDALLQINMWGNAGLCIEFPENTNFLTNLDLSFDKIERLIFPTSFSEYKGKNPFPSASIGTIVLKSPSVVKMANMTLPENTSLEVPDFLVASYKTADKWYKATEVRAIDSKTIKDWNFTSDVEIFNSFRFSNQPNITIKQTGSFNVYGNDAALVLGNLTIENNLKDKKYGRLIGEISNFTSSGNVAIKEYMVKNTWYFISLPFSVKVSDIAFLDGSAQKAIRYYDGANRAKNGTGTNINNWKNFDANATISAGQGFIFQANNDGWWIFPATADTKNQLTSKQTVQIALAENSSSTAANKGWNLVGNPYQAWYNNHSLNFSSPITVRKADNSGYEAYSLIDDDYAIAPNQAFFVQCSSASQKIEFPISGRQLTDEIINQNGAPERIPVANSRVLVDLGLSDGENTDRTRVVMNDAADMLYEMNCDASKFLSEANVAQVYTLDTEETMYAINERPNADGEVRVGVVIPENGNYKFSLLRNTAESVYLRDNETGTLNDITNSEYEFYAEAGTNAERFTLVVGETRALEMIESDAESGKAEIFSISGAKVGNSIDALPQGTYIIKSNGSVKKVTVK